MRQLPTVNFAGTDFFVDFRLNEFRQVDDPNNKISLNELEDLPNGACGFLFDINTKNTPSLGQYINLLKLKTGSKLPAHIKIVSIPDLLALNTEGVKHIKT